MAPPRGGPRKRPAAAAGAAPAKLRKQEDGLLPVSTLCGFLGAGKTTLLKHILEDNHSREGGFRCAVIVNDMAELNIDKALIDESALVQSDDVIAMENGCVCCTLKGDLVEQIVGLARQSVFDYMIIEASGVSEPSQIARLFASCDKDHDHDEEHGQQDAMSDFARLDTCVTVVDAADFFTKLDMVEYGPDNQSFPHLLVEQVEYANVVVLNKSDLVSKQQLEKVKDQVRSLNPKAKILASRNCQIDVMEVVNTGLYKLDDFSCFHHAEDNDEEETFVLPCCRERAEKGESACCNSSSKVIHSGRSTVVLASSQASDFLRLTGKAQTARHASRFGISSFLYKARRPFHPERFDANFVTPFFLFHDGSGDGDDSEEDARSRRSRGKVSKKEQDRLREAREARIFGRQKEAADKQAARTKRMGALFRSKGFIWISSRHDLMGVYSSAGSVLTIEFPAKWKALEAKAWLGTEAERAGLRKDWAEPFGDRRQDLVFIGKDLKHEAIQGVLDDCLLTDDELAMGIDGWKAAFGDVLLENAASEEGEDEEDDEGGG